MTHASVFAISAGLALALAAPGSQAQQAPRAQEKKEIIIREKGEQKEKMTIVIDGDQVTVNGKPLADYDGDNIVIRKRNAEEGTPYVFVAPRAPQRSRVYRVPQPPNPPGWRYSMEDDMVRETRREPRAFLGVVTEKDEKGAKITEVSPASAAAKAGLKEGDIITSVGGKPVTGPETLVELIRARKPDEEVEIGYLRDKKKKTLKLKLGKQDIRTSRSFEFTVPDVDVEILQELEPAMRRLHRELEPELRRAQREQERVQRDLEREFRNMDGFRWEMEPFDFPMAQPKMGIRIEDTEDGKGVKIIDVEAGSPAEKAGLKKDDIVTFIDGKKINNTDEARTSMREGRNKASLPVTVMRGANPFNTEVKMPRDLKKADLEP